MNTLENKQATTMTTTKTNDNFDNISDDGSETIDLGDRDGGRTVQEFEDMGLKDSLLRGIFGLGFEHPSTVQAKAIVPAITGRDMVIQAQSGTGKTGTFSIAMLQQVDEGSRDLQALVLSPTRELALQTHRVVAALSQHMGVHVHASVGGRDVRNDAQTLRRGGVQVVCGTPGRVLDMIKRGQLDTGRLRVLVLDEADVMLDEGFQDQIRDIFAELPKQTQCLCVSATLSPAVLRLTEQFLRSPLRLLVKEEQITLAGISQFYIDCGRDDTKVDVLLDLYETLTVSQCVIFCNTRRRVLQVADELTRNDFTVSVIHADMTQDEREATMRDFVAGSSRVLIATDIIGRGLDVQQVSVVVNFDLPRERANYIHRIGRGGRFGRKAIAVSLITDRDARDLKDLQEYYATEIREMPRDVMSYL
jgi:translation initiation factor 4A